VSRFLVLRARTRFRRFRGRRVPFLMFCALVLIFGGAEGVVSRFHILRARTRFRRYRGRRLPFLCFARPDSFSAVPRASCPVFMFCAPGLGVGSIEGVGSRFHVLRARPRFRRYRGRHVPFSCFARPDTFSAVPRASCPIFMFCVPGIDFGGAEGGVSRFDVLHARIRFRRYRERPLPFSSFARPNLSSAVQRASGPVFKFCTP
jgi:hypothetical protein